MLHMKEYSPHTVYPKVFIYTNKYDVNVSIKLDLCQDMGEKEVNK